jgi:hypothetical protein
MTWPGGNHRVTTFLAPGLNYFYQHCVTCLYTHCVTCLHPHCVTCLYPHCVTCDTNEYAGLGETMAPEVIGKIGDRMDA